MMLIPFENDKVRVTQGFNYGYHNGMDLVGVDTAQLVAIGDGVIESAVNLDVHYTEPLVTDRTREWGTYVKLRLDDGTICFYCHMQYNSLEVVVGDRVTKGDHIGLMGNTGYSFGAHCHFEIRSSANIVTPDINTATYTNIPNAVGVYENDNGDEAMTKEEKKAFEELVNRVNALEKRENKTEDRTGIKYAWITSKSGKDSVPKWAVDDIRYLYEKGILKGASASGSLELSYVELRLAVLISRAMQYIMKKINK